MNIDHGRIILYKILNLNAVHCVRKNDSECEVWSDEVNILIYFTILLYVYLYKNTKQIFKFLHFIKNIATR